jgi:lipoyl(octanoyl) transferase
MSQWRLLISDALPGADNMALDEALLLQRTATDVPILRLYQWDQDTLSLGRFQKSKDVLSAVRGSAPVVRRISSGGAILHRHDEITYAIIAPYRLFGGRSPRLAYHAIHDILTLALQHLGVWPQKRPETQRDEKAPFCYDRLTDFDLTAGELFKKLIGSAQHRRGRAFLQHGSIPLNDDGHVAGGTSISRLLARQVTRLEVTEAIIAAFQEVKKIELKDSAVNAAEEKCAQELKASRYGCDSWTFER